MKIYFAGAPKAEFLFPKLFSVVSNRLLSYNIIGKSPSMIRTYLEENTELFNSIIVDSGAFSVWMTGKKINIDDYINFLLKYQHKVDFVVNLDVIPGKPWQKRISPSEIEYSAKLSYENYLYMLERGIDRNKLIHVFHQNESFKWLEKMLEDGLSYVGISPANDRTTKEKAMWLNKVMEIICDSKGRPLVKFHGFAVTSFVLMSKYPWTSVDSNAWNELARRGVIFFPLKKKGKWCFVSRPLLISISNVTSRKNYYKNLSEIIQKNLFEYLEMHNMPLGKSEFLLVDKNYKIRENEKLCTRAYAKSLNLSTPPAGKKWIERIIEDGVVVNVNYRKYLNAFYLLEFVKTIKNANDDTYKPLHSASLGLSF